jgi:ABC-type Fe3+-hydroxamate transport system substrate-binding protein
MENLLAASLDREENAEKKISQLAAKVEKLQEVIDKKEYTLNV